MHAGFNFGGLPFVVIEVKLKPFGYEKAISHGPHRDQLAGCLQ